MGENVNPQRGSKVRRLQGLAVVITALLGYGCASAPSSREVRPAAEGAAEARTGETRQAATRTIATMALVERAPATVLELSASEPLVWTSYRDSEGNLVIELPNSVPGSSVEDVAEAAGLVAAVDVELDEGGSRPLTRLTVSTRGEAEHTLSAEGSNLRLELLPVGGRPASGADNLVADSLVPLPEDGHETDQQESGEPAARELAAVEPEATDALTTGTEEWSREDAEPAQQAAAPEPTPEPLQAASPGDLAVQRSTHAIARPATLLAGVSVQPATAGTVLKLSGDGGFRYSSFRLENPDRFVIDLEGIVNASERSTVAVASELVDRVRIAQFKPYPQPVSRVVFDLRYGQSPAIEPLADGLMVRFGAAQASALPAKPEAVPAAEPFAVEPEAEPEAEPAVAELPPATAAEVDSSAASYAGAEPLPVRQLDEPSEVAEAEPVAESPAESVWEQDVEPPAYEVAETPMAESEAPVGADDAERVEPDFAATQEAETQVADSPTSPETVRPSAPPAPAFEPEPPPPTDVALFEAAQLEVQSPQERSQAMPVQVGTEVVGSGGRVYVGEPITLSLKDADIKDVLRSFSGITGLNVVVHPGVRGSVTVELKEVPWDQALDLILKINGLDYVLEGNIMRIASTAQLSDEAQARRRLAAARAQEVPLQTVIRAVSYAQASAIARMLGGSTAGGGGRSGGGGSGRARTGAILSSRGSVTVDARTNKLIIKELPGNMNTVLAIIDNLDTAEPQVLIEARIVETNKNYSRTLGIAWDFGAIADDRFGNTTGLQFPHRASAGGGVNLLTGGRTGFLDISLGNVLDTFTLDASLQAAENEGLVTILSEPKIATLNNQRASIQSGLQIPIQTVSNNTVSVQFVNATLSLEVTPQVTAEGTVLMDINIAKREPQLAFAIAGAANAPISTKQARTRVIVRDGGTTVIGGIYEVSNNRGEDRVPGLANVPILGHLFKNRRRNNDNEELLIFITPRVIQL